MGAFSSAKAMAFEIQSSKWGAFRAEYNNHFLTGLRLVALNMPSGESEEVIQHEVLGGLQTDIEELTNRVLLSDLNADLKWILINGLQSVRQAIVEYRVSGAAGISQELDRSIGSLVRHRHKFKDFPNGDEKEVISAFWNVMGKVDEVVSTALRVAPLAIQAYQGIRNMLNGGE